MINATIFTFQRNPGSAKRMEGIKDWHLMLIVFSFVLVDIVLLVIYTALEGFITHYSVGIEHNEERPSSIHGVSVQLSIECLEIWVKALYIIHELVGIGN